MLAAFRIAWNGAIFLLLALSSGPFLVKAWYLLVGAWAGVSMTALWSGKADLSGLRAWQIVAFLIAFGLIVLGVLVYRS